MKNVCPACGAKLKKDSEVCSQCGGRLYESEFSDIAGEVEGALSRVDESDLEAVRRESMGTAVKLSKAEFRELYEPARKQNLPSLRCLSIFPITKIYPNCIREVAP